MKHFLTAFVFAFSLHTVSETQGLSVIDAYPDNYCAVMDTVSADNLAVCGSHEGLKALYTNAYNRLVDLADGGCKQSARQLGEWCSDDNDFTQTDYNVAYSYFDSSLSAEPVNRDVNTLNTMASLILTCNPFNEEVSAQRQRASGILKRALEICETLKVSVPQILLANLERVKQIS